MSQVQGKSSNARKIDDLARSAMQALGIDLGGTKIKAGVVRGGKLIGETVQVSTPVGPEKIIQALTDLVLKFKEKEDLAGVGVATAGIVDCNTGEVIGSTGNLPGWAGTKLKSALESKVLLPVHVDNDANAAAYGESRCESLRNLTCVVVVTLGTGIGGGLIINGKLYHGSRWAAGEIGHIRISLNNERLCTCGLFDCWEAYGSGRGLLATAAQLLDGVAEGQSPLAQSPASLSTYAVFAAANQDDLMAQKIVHRWHEHVSHGMVNLAHILNPDCFVITGGLSDSVDLQLLTEMIIDRTLSSVSENIQVRTSELEGNAGIVGAAQFVIDELLTDKTKLVCQ
ncbi:MAG: ROK family protein [Candidatus Obscuribacterales bacterium]|nr:ROK family protein [Candidatus Obscuribacterales bacterium]